MAASDTLLTWRKSRYCGNATCVEVALAGTDVWVRDRTGRVLRFSRAAWLEFLEGVRSGEFGGTLPPRHG